MVIFVVVIMVFVKHLIKRSKEKVNTLSSIKLVWIIHYWGMLPAGSHVGLWSTDNHKSRSGVLDHLHRNPQGFYIFLFFCVLNGDVRSTWLKTLPCKHLTTKMMCTTIKEPSKPQSTSRSALLSHSHTNSKEMESDLTKDKGQSAQVEEQMELTMVNNYENVEN